MYIITYIDKRQFIVNDFYKFLFFVDVIKIEEEKTGKIIYEK